MRRPFVIFSGLLLNVALAAPAAAEPVPLSGSISATGTVTWADAASIEQVWGIAPRAGDAFAVRVDVGQIIPVAMLTPLSSPGPYHWTGSMTFSTAGTSVSLSTDRGRALVSDVEQTCTGGCTPGDSFRIGLNTNTPVLGFNMSMYLFPEPYGQDWIHSPDIPPMPNVMSPFDGSFRFGHNYEDERVTWLQGDINAVSVNLAPIPTAPAPIPEPSTVLLLGTALVGAAAQRWKRADGRLHSPLGVRSEVEEHTQAATRAPRRERATT